ncbi:MAG: HU family DNA-binding protein [Microbacter sp.]
MTHKEFIGILTTKTSLPEEEVSDMLEHVVNLIGDTLSQGNAVTLQGIGTFEAHRKEERIAMNPRTRKRLLIPPKQVVVFKPIQSLKDQVKKTSRYE